MGPLLALVVIGLILIGLVGAIFGGLNLIFQTIFSYFPYFVALVILGYLVTKFGGNRNRMGEAEAGALGAVGGAAASEIADRIGGDGGDGPSTTPTSPPPSSPPSSTGDDSSSSDGDVDVTVGGDSMSQQQQQQQQQMQELILALLEGNLGQGGGGNFVAYGPQQQQQQMLGGLSPGVYSMFMQQVSMMQINQQMLMQQMMEFFMGGDYEEVDNQFIIQFMKQVLDIDIDEGDVEEGDVILQINQVIQQIDIDVLYQNIQKIIQEVNITNETYIEQLMAIIVSLEEGDFEREGDVIIIYAHQEIRINSATLLTFLNIVQVAKYWELKQLMVALIEMSVDMSWEVKIEKLIVIFRESDSGEEDELVGSKWEILERRLKASDLDSNLVEILLDIFLLRDPNKKYGFSPQKIMLLRDRASKVPREDFPDLAAGIINYIEANNVGNINSNTIDSLISYIENNWPVEPQNNINNNLELTNDNMAASLEHNVQELIEKIEQEQQIQQEVTQIDEDAIEKLRMALEYYEREKPLLEAIRQLKLPDHNNVSFQQSMKQAMEINQNLSDYDLLDESSIEEIRRDTHGMLDNLEKALEDLKQADQDLEQEVQIDSNLEKHISRIEETVQQEMNTSLKRLQSFQAQNNS